MRKNYKGRNTMRWREGRKKESRNAKEIERNVERQTQSEMERRRERVTAR